MPAHKVRLEICGSSYTVSTNDSDEYLLDLAEKLDTDMKEVLAQAPNASVTSAAIITALGYLDQAAKNASGADNMREQLQNYLEDAAKAKSEAEKYRRELEQLKSQSSTPPKSTRTARSTKSSSHTVPLEETEIVETIEPLDGQMDINDYPEM